MMLIGIEPGSRYFRGHVRRLQQSALEAVLLIGPLDGIDAAALEQAVTAGLASPEPVPDNSPHPAHRLADCIGHWSGQIQRQARLPVSYRYGIEAARSADHNGRLRVRVTLPAIAEACGQLVLQGLVEAIELAAAQLTGEAPPETAADRIVRLAESLRRFSLPSYNVPQMLDAAYRMDIPVCMAEGLGLRFGSGARARVADSTVTENTPGIGLVISQSKTRTASVLRAAGLPAPTHIEVDSAAAAIAAAVKLGYPVVVKPADQDQGRGVAANLRTERSVVAAYAAAAALSRHVLVEKHVAGFGHRLTVYRGELIGAVRRIPGGVTGDGQHSITELLKKRLSAPEVRRNLNLGRVSLDAEALEMLADLGMGPATVLENGRFVSLRRRDNISAGGNVDQLLLTDVHPDNELLAIEAAAAVLLDFAGIDLLIPDIRVSWRESDAIICEVNGRPQFSHGRDGQAHLRALSRLLGDSPRIPVHLYIDDDRAPTTLAARTERARLALKLDTVSSRDGVRHDTRLLTGAFDSHWQAAWAALGNRRVHGLLMVLTIDEILSSGLPIDRIDGVIVGAGVGRAPADSRQLIEALNLCGASRSAISREHT